MCNYIMSLVILQSALPYSAIFDGENIDGFNAILVIRLSIIPSGIANTGGLGYCLSIFSSIKFINEVHPSTFFS